MAAASPSATMTTRKPEEPTNDSEKENVGFREDSPWPGHVPPKIRTLPAVHINISHSSSFRPVRRAQSADT